MCAIKYFLQAVLSSADLKRKTLYRLQNIRQIKIGVTYICIFCSKRINLGCKMKSILPKSIKIMRLE